jgi:hypothetical protein
MLPLLAVVVVLSFLVLQYTGILDDLGKRSAQEDRQAARALSVAPPKERKRELDPRLKVFENFIQQLSKDDSDEKDSGETDQGANRSNG